MNTILTSLIQIAPNRQRVDHDPGAHQELITSIQTFGLMHAPILRRQNGSWFLVAGERRLRAIKEIYEFGGGFHYDASVDSEGVSTRIVFEAEENEVPFINLGDLSPLEAEEAELEENLRRTDLSWQEQATAEERILNLRRAQAKEAGLPPTPLADVAKEARGSDTPASVQALTRNVILAHNLHRPEVKAAKSAAEAMKILTRTEEAERNIEKAAALGKEFLGTKHQLFNQDCLAWVRDYDTRKGLFDVICTDPPYGMGADEFGDSGGGAVGAHFYKDDEKNFNEFVIPTLRELFRITKDDAHAYVFCDFDRFHSIKRNMKETGWEVFRTPLIWFTPSKFRAPWPEKGPQRKYETILYAVKGDLKCTKVAGDVLTYPTDENLGHQAQKPVGLYQDLLSRSVRPGMRVLDPFCGTGPVFPAAHSLSAVATGVEGDPAAFAISATRVQGLKEGL
jgi:DNA modification methylase